MGGYRTLNSNLIQRSYSHIKVCIVVPMYNEERIARVSAKTIIKYIKALPPVVTLLIVNDGSRDKTEDIITAVAGQYQRGEFMVISHTNNQGYGTALKTGIGYAVDQKYDYVLFMDSDLTNHPKYLSVFYEKMQKGWDYIKATRYARGGRVEGVSWMHRAISIVGNFIARRLYGLPLTDITNGFRAVRVDILRQMNLKENDFAIILEELTQAKHLTHSFCEIPYTLTSRKKGQGTTHFSYSPKTCARYLKQAIMSRF